MILQSLNLPFVLRQILAVCQCSIFLLLVVLIVVLSSVNQPLQIFPVLLLYYAVGPAFLGREDVAHTICWACADLYFHT